MLELLLKAKQNMKNTFCIKIFPYPLVSSALGTSVIMHSESLGMKTLPTKIMQEIISAKKKNIIQVKNITTMSLSKDQFEFKRTKKLKYF